MRKIIIDTNVLVSGIIQRGHCYYILDNTFSDPEIELCLSKDLLNEYLDVLNRPRFLKFPDFIANANLFLGYSEDSATFYTPRVNLDIIKDPDDNKLIELADCAKAHYLITGNTNDFTIKEYNETLIVTPREYWEKYLI